MKEEIASLCVGALRAKLELGWIAAATLMDALDHSNLTHEEKCDTSLRWQQVTQEGDLLAFALDLIRRQQKESTTRGTTRLKLCV
ncbi:MAG: hypothetical protein WBV28_13185 [Terracidiphilus sp.]